MLTAILHCYTHGFDVCMSRSVRVGLLIAAINCATFYNAWSLCLFIPCFITLFRSAWLLPAALWLARQDACTCFEPRVETANCQTGNWTTVREIQDWIKKFRNTSVWAVKVLEVVCRQWTRRVAEFSVSGVRVVYASKMLRMCGRRRTIDDQFPRLCTDRVERVVSARCRCVAIVSWQRQQGLLRCVVENASTSRYHVGSLDQRSRGQQNVDVPSSVNRRREQAPLLRTVSWSITVYYESYNAWFGRIAFRKFSEWLRE